MKLTKHQMDNITNKNIAILLDLFESLIDLISDEQQKLIIISNILLNLTANMFVKRLSADKNDIKEYFKAFYNGLNEWLESNPNFNKGMH